VIAVAMRQIIERVSQAQAKIELLPVQDRVEVENMNAPLPVGTTSPELEPQLPQPTSSGLISSLNSSVVSMIPSFVSFWAALIISTNDVSPSPDVAPVTVEIPFEAEVPTDVNTSIIFQESSAMPDFHTEMESRQTYVSMLQPTWSNSDSQVTAAVVLSNSGSTVEWHQEEHASALPPSTERLPLPSAVEIHHPPGSWSDSN